MELVASQARALMLSVLKGATAAPTPSNSLSPLGARRSYRDIGPDTRGRVVAPHALPIRPRIERGVGGIPGQGVDGMGVKRRHRRVAPCGCGRVVIPYAVTGRSRVE